MTIPKETSTPRSPEEWCLKFATCFAETIPARPCGTSQCGDSNQRETAAKGRGEQEGGARARAVEGIHIQYVEKLPSATSSRTYTQMHFLQDYARMTKYLLTSEKSSNDHFAFNLLLAGCLWRRTT